MVRIHEHVPLAPLTTFRIGGSARYLIEARTEDDIREAFLEAKRRSVPFIVLAGGSNVLVPDEGLDALVVRIVGGDFSFSGAELSADAGCVLLDLIREASRCSLGGWESLAGIPGTIGGAVRGNAGAFGTEMKDVVVKVRAFDTETGDTREFENIACSFSYRNSFFKENPEWLITRAFVALERVDAEESARRAEETIRERERRHLQNVQAAGSFFMNPVAPEAVRRMFEEEKGAESREGRVPAGWLIEKAGMKGAVVGGAKASEQHPNYLVNTGNATAKDVRELAERIKKEVREKCGIELKEEAVVLG